MPPTLQVVLRGGGGGDCCASGAGCGGGGRGGGGRCTRGLGGGRGLGAGRGLGLRRGGGGLGLGLGRGRGGGGLGRGGRGGGGLGRAGVGGGRRGRGGDGGGLSERGGGLGAALRCLPPARTCCQGRGRITSAGSSAQRALVGRRHSGSGNATAAAVDGSWRMQLLHAGLTSVAPSFVSSCRLPSEGAVCAVAASTTSRHSACASSERAGTAWLMLIDDLHCEGCELWCGAGGEFVGV
jgi:hypothetical protein